MRTTERVIDIGIVASIINLILWCVLGVYLAKIKVSERQAITVILIVMAMELTVLFSGGIGVYN